MLSDYPNTCIVCTAGRFFNSTEATSCTQCYAGTFASSDGVYTTCTQCNAGLYVSETGSSACRGCAPGTYSSKLGASSNLCSNCATGKYSSSAGATSCKLFYSPFAFDHIPEPLELLVCSTNASWAVSILVAKQWKFRKIRTHPNPH